MNRKLFLFAIILALSLELGMAAQGATNVPVTATATGGEAGDSAVVLDDTTM